MKESLLTDIFLQAGLFFALASLVIPVLRYLKVPTALGYLLAGIVLGPYGLGALVSTFPFLGIISLEDSQHVKILAELSIILLLFVIGLELTPMRLWQMRHLVFGLGSAQVLVSATIIGVFAYFWGNNIQVSILLGLSLALSSTAITVQWLQEKKLFANPVGRTSFSILLLQDLAVIPILFLLTIFAADFGDNVINFISISLLKMAGAVLAIYYLGRLCLKPVFFFANKHGGPEVFVAVSLLTIVISASVAHYAGLSMALGAFIAGVLLAETEYRHEVSSFIIPFKSMLLGIFFFSFGMGINLGYISEKPFWLLSSVIGLMTIKAIIIFIFCKLWKQTTAVSAESAILLSQSGEFGLLVVGSALSLALIDQNVGQFMLITIGLTMILTPTLSPIARKLGKSLEEKDQNRDKYMPSPEEKITPHIVIFGYGRIGRNVGNDLSKEGFTIIGFDKKIEEVNISRKNSYPVYLGDATKKATLNAASLESALCVVITLDDTSATKKIIKLLREDNKNIPVVIRAHSAADYSIFESYENVDIIAEDTLISDELSEIALEHCKTPLSKSA